MKRTLFFIMLILAFRIHAQNTALKGQRIHDTETKEPVIGANIAVKGKLIGTVTDSKGNFTLVTTCKFPLYPDDFQHRISKTGN